MWKVASVVALAACSSSPAHPVPSGAHYTYAIDQLFIPRNNTEARTYAIDLNGDGTLDNQLGMVFGTTESMGFVSAEPTQAAIAGGQIAITLDLQTPDFTTADAAAIGVSTMPGYTLAGAASDGSFDLGPGELTLQFAFEDPSFVISLPLRDAHVVVDGVTDAGIATGILAGGASQQALDDALFPVVQQAFAFVVARDCGHLSTTTCGCYPNSDGDTLIGNFDTTPADCTITTDEIVNNDLILSLFAPDIRDSLGELLSVGVGFTAVAAPH